MSSFRRGACALIVLAWFGCDKKTEKAAPATGMPPLDQPAAPAAAAPSAHPVHEPSAATDDNNALPAGHPPIAAGGSGETAAGFEGATPVVEFDPKTVVSGVIKLDPKVKAKVQSGDTIFVVARRWEPGDGPQQGTPLAVKKLTVGTWPLVFSLDSRDAMMVGTKMEGKVIVTARVDKDGDAITKNPGDVAGQSKAVEPPSKNVVVPLDTAL
jgi:hypothetical protein